MPFATIDDIKAAIGADRLRDIADFDVDGSVDSPTVTAALEEATSLAQSYLYDETIPDPPPPALRRAVVDIAVHQLREPRDGGTDASLRAYTAAIDWLQRIADGKASLTPTKGAGGESSGDIAVDARDKQWTDDARRMF